MGPFPKLNQEVNSNFLFEELVLALWTDSGKTQRWFSWSPKLGVYTLTVSESLLPYRITGLEKKVPVVGWVLVWVGSEFSVRA